ncbi:MAG: ROK family protein [Blastocatellia bacterium]
MPKTATNEAINGRAIIGLDLGSKAIRHGLVDYRNQVSGFGSESYDAEAVQSGESLVDQIRRVISRTLAGQSTAAIDGIGLAVPGLVQAAGHRIHDIANLPDLAGIDLQSILEKEFRLPVTIENNARAAARAELDLGAARGIDNFLYLHIGSNFSAGLVLEGRLQHGKSGLAGAIGRMNIYVEHLATSVRLEDLVSAANIVRRTSLRLERDKTSALSRLASRGGFSYDDIIDCAHKGDQLSRMMIDRTGIFIAIAIADVISLLNLSMITIGGAVAARQFLVEAIDREVRQRMSEVLFDGCQIVAAALGPEATVQGVGMMVRERLVG